jgi:regulatory protein
MDNAIDPLRRVAGVHRGEKRGQRVVVLDDGRELVLPAARVRDEGIAAGAAILESRIETLCRDDARAQAHETALRLLSYRPRTEQEIQLRLRQRGIDAETAERETRRLRMAGLIDDEQFAASWVEGRQRNAARSSRALAGELRAKGVGRRIADAAASDIDDEQAALNLARQRAVRMHGLDAATRDRRLAALLQRRGFSYRIIEQTLRALADREQPD